MTLQKPPTRTRLKSQGTSLVRPHSTGPRQNGFRLVQRTQASAKTWKGSVSRHAIAGQIEEKERVCICQMMGLFHYMFSFSTPCL